MRKSGHVKVWNSAIDAACDRSAEAWTAELRRREGRAFRRGYADATVMKNRVGKQPYELREAYREGYYRRKEDEREMEAERLAAEELRAAG